MKIFKRCPWNDNAKSILTLWIKTKDDVKTYFKLQSLNNIFYDTLWIPFLYIRKSKNSLKSHSANLLVYLYLKLSCDKYGVCKWQSKAGCKAKDNAKSKQKLKFLGKLNRKLNAPPPHSCLDWLPEGKLNANFELVALNGILVPNHWSALN